MLFSFSFTLHAQVVIGLDESPVSGALLQLKDKKNVVDDAVNAQRGLSLPRVALTQKNELYPMFLQDADNPALGPNAEYIANKAAIDKVHTGLIVYNLTEDDGKELCLGLNQWDGKQWNCFQQKLGNAIAHIDDCANITFLGQYQDKVSLNSGNYMNISLVVTKPGAYTVTARAAYAANSSLDNGYYFTTTGVFLTAGKYTLQVPGSGTPLLFTPSSHPAGDVITITMNDRILTLSDESTSCPKNIVVEDSSKKPEYVMLCNRTSVRGVYKLNNELNNTNYIDMVLSVDLAAVGATYIIETDEVDGISFKGQGVLTNFGEQAVRLYGYGTPNSLADKHFTIKSNSIKTVATCEAKVTMVIPKKRIYTLGHDAGYGYNLSSTSASRAVLTAPANFGVLENSKVKVDMPNFDFIVSGYTAGEATLYITSVRNELTNNKPDIVFITQDTYISTSLATELIDYLNKGGVLFFCWEANATSAKLFFTELFGNGITQTTGGALGGGSIYRFNNINDEILNGPFGDIRNKYWGEDASWAIGLSNLPVGELDIYSYGNDYSNKPSTETNKITGLPLVFKHKTLNLFFFADGGFSSCPSAGPNTSNIICPFSYNTSTMAPIAKTNYGYGTTRFDVYNSQAWCNAMAWAIKQAQFNGINTR